MKLQKIVWTAKRSEAQEKRIPRPIPGLTVTFEPQKEFVTDNGATVFLTTHRGKTNNRGELVDLLTERAGIFIPRANVNWLVSIYGSNHIEPFTFYMNSVDQPDTFNLASWTPVPERPEDADLTGWLNLAVSVTESVERA